MNKKQHLSFCLELQHGHKFSGMEHIDGSHQLSHLTRALHEPVIQKF